MRLSIPLLFSLTILSTGYATPCDDVAAYVTQNNIPSLSLFGTNCSSTVAIDTGVDYGNRNHWSESVRICGCCKVYPDDSVCSPSTGTDSVSANAAITTANFANNNPSVGASLAMGAGAELAALINESDSYLAQAGDETALPSGSAMILAKGKDHNAVWGKGLYQHIDDAGDILQSFGGYVGYDYFYKGGMVGFFGGYSQSVLSKTSLGRSGHTDVANGTIRGESDLGKGFYTQYGIVGNANFNHYNRTTAGGTARSRYFSYVIDPYLNFGYDWAATSWFIVEPFVRTQYIFLFQNSFTETGSSGLNLHSSAYKSGDFRIEPGIEFYEHWTKCWGTLILRQKFSYVRNQSMYGSDIQLRFVEFGDDFTISTGDTGDNLGSFSGQIFARLKSGFFISAVYRGEWSSNFALNEARLRLGTYF